MNCTIYETIVDEPGNFYWMKDLNGSDAPVHGDCLIRQFESQGQSEAAKQIYENNKFVLTLPKG